MAGRESIGEMALRFREEYVKGVAEAEFYRSLDLVPDQDLPGKPLDFDIIFSDAGYGLDHRRGNNLRATLGAMSAFGLTTAVTSRMLEHGGVAVCDLDLYLEGSPRPYIDIGILEIDPIFEGADWGERMVEAYADSVRGQVRRDFLENAEFLKGNSPAYYARLVDGLRRQAVGHLDYAVPLVCPYGPFKATSDGQLAFLDMREREGYRYEVSNLLNMVEVFGAYFDKKDFCPGLSSEQEGRLSGIGGRSVFAKILGKLRNKRVEEFTDVEKQGVEVLRRVVENLDRRIWYQNFLYDRIYDDTRPYVIDSDLLSYWFFPASFEKQNTKKALEIQRTDGFSQAKKIFEEAVLIMCPNCPISLRTLEGFMESFSTMPDESKHIINVGNKRAKTIVVRDESCEFNVILDLARINLFREGFNGSSVVTPVAAYEEARRRCGGFSMRMDFPDFKKLGLFRKN